MSAPRLMSTRVRYRLYLKASRFGTLTRPAQLASCPHEPAGRAHASFLPAALRWKPSEGLSPASLRPTDNLGPRDLRQ